MNYVGDFDVGAIVQIWYNTFDSNDPSASVTTTDLIDTDVHIYKDDGLTQRVNAAGVAVDIDVDTFVGVHKITIDTADNTVGDFFEAGHDYAVVVEGTTVDVATVNAVVGTFSIANRRVAGQMCVSSIEALTDQSNFTLTAGEASANNDAYNGCTIIVTDQITRIQKAVGHIFDYVGSTRAIVLHANPLQTAFTMAIGDSVEIFATSAFANVNTVGQTPQTANDNGADINSILVGTVTDAQGVNVATDVAGMIDGSSRVDVGSWLGQAVTLSGGNKPDVNVNEISDDATAADNLESQYDETGLIGDTFPHTQAAGAALGGGLSINTTMVSVTVIQGSEQDLANTTTSDDSRWTGDDDGAGAEFIFRCTPAEITYIPVRLAFEGYYDEPSGASNGATLQVYNFDTSMWDTIATFVNNNSDEHHEIPLSHAHEATGSGTLETVPFTIGDVLIKFKQDTTETGNACLLIDYMVVGYVGSPITAAEIVDEWETQSQADPTGFHTNVLEVNGTAQTANDNGSDLSTITGSDGVKLATAQGNYAPSKAGDAMDLIANAVDASALADDAITEIWNKAMVDISAGAPSATASVLTAINYLFTAWRNKTITDTSGGTDYVTVYKDNGTTALTKSTVADNGVDTFTKGEYGAP